jgi:iron(III) transport system ATP-binding protein
MISDGIMEQWDSAYGVYHRPSTEAVAKFIGEGVLIQGKSSSNGTISCALGILKPNTNVPLESHLNILVRPEDIAIDESGPLKAVVTEQQFRGANILYTLRLDNGEKILALVESHLIHSSGENITFRLVMDHVVFFPRSNQET